MTIRATLIEPLAAPVTAADLDGLAELLCDVVAHGASVSFLPPLAHTRARAFWQGAVVLPPRGVTFIARDGGALVGCVQLCPAWAPNQPHRAEVAKMLVHSTARRRGIGARLLTALEAHARAVGFTLLTLDTEAGSAGEAFYQRFGWTLCGRIPDYALDVTGALVATALFYKSLA